MEHSDLDILKADLSAAEATLDAFVDEVGAVYSLVELRSKGSLAFTAYTSALQAFRKAKLRQALGGKAISVEDLLEFPHSEIRTADDWAKFSKTVCASLPSDPRRFAVFIACLIGDVWAGDAWAAESIEFDDTNGPWTFICIPSTYPESTDDPSLGVSVDVRGNTTLKLCDAKGIPFINICIDPEGVVEHFYGDVSQWTTTRLGSVLRTILPAWVAMGHDPLDITSHFWEKTKHRVPEECRLFYKKLTDWSPDPAFRF